MSVFWLGFGLGDRPLGVAIIRADSPYDALMETIVKDMNPGGGCEIMEMPEDDRELMDKWRPYIGQFLCPGKLDRLGAHKALSPGIKQP